MTAGALTRAPLSALSISRGAFIGLGATIPISTALDTVLTLIILAGWLVAARFRETVNAARANPVAVVACVWVLAHLLGATYSIGGPRDVMDAIRDAAVFLLIPIGAVVLKDPRDVRLAHAAFMAVIAVTVILSTLRWIGVIPPDVPFLKDTNLSATVVFKSHLIQNNLVAFGAFVFAVYARRARSPRVRLVLGGAAAWAAINVLVMGDGRTGQVVLLVLIVYYGAWIFGRRGIFAAGVAAIAAGAIAYAIPGSSLQKRSDIALSEAAQWDSRGHHTGGSVGERLDFYYRTLHIISDNPLLGVGTGGFATADRQQTAGTGLPPTTNPHNQYLLQAAELGVVGPLLVIALFWVHWRAAARLPEPGDTGLARGLVLAFAVGSLANSMLRDHVEALLFVWMSALLFARLRTGDT